MGIKNFAYILKHATKGVYTASYSDFKGQTWAIDASIFCYRFSYNSQIKRTNPHIDGFYQLFYRLLKHGIRPVIVFDGKVPDEKQHTIDVRTKQKQKQLDKITLLRNELIELIGQTKENIQIDDIQIDDIQIDDIPTYKQLEHISIQYRETDKEYEITNKIKCLNKLIKNIIDFPPGIYEDIRHLCDLMNVPFIRAQGEADVLCAQLYQNGQVQAIMSEDSDILLYGGGILIRKFSWTSNIEVLDLKLILQSLGISHDQFIDLAILSGTDYTISTIGGLGYTTALEYIGKGMNIEQIIELIHKDNNTRFHVPNEEIFPYQKARTLIKTAYQNEPTVTIQPFNIRNIIPIQLTNLLMLKCNYRQLTVTKHIQQLQQFYGPPRVKIILRRKSITPSI